MYILQFLCLRFYHRSTFHIFNKKLKSILQNFIWLYTDQVTLTFSVGNVLHSYNRVSQFISFFIFTTALLAWCSITGAVVYFSFIYMNFSPAGIFCWSTCAHVSDAASE